MNYAEAADAMRLERDVRIRGDKRTWRIAHVKTVNADCYLNLWCGDGSERLSVPSERVVLIK